MKKILLTAILLSLGSFNLQADENHYKDDKHMEHSHQHKDKDKGKKRFDRSFLECLGKKEGEIIKTESHRGDKIEKKCVLVAIPIKK